MSLGKLIRKPIAKPSFHLRHVAITQIKLFVINGCGYAQEKGEYAAINLSLVKPPEAVSEVVNFKNFPRGACSSLALLSTVNIGNSYIHIYIYPPPPPPSLME